jgi:hypothetical protein
MESIPQATLSTLAAAVWDPEAVHLPLPNPFLPTNFTVLPLQITLSGTTGTKAPVAACHVQLHVDPVVVHVHD